MAKVDRHKAKRFFLGKEEWGREDVFQIILLAIFLFLIIFMYLKLNEFI